MRSFWTKSQKRKKIIFLSVFFLIKNEKEERSPYFLPLASAPSLYVPQHSGAI